jgi:hypothetical protein
MKKTLFVITTLAFGLQLRTDAQQVVQVESISVSKLEFKTQPTPQFGAGNVEARKIPRPREWVEVEAEFRIKANERDAVVPELLFRYHVAVRDKEGKTKVLTGDVTHVNMVAGDDCYSAMYISPTTMGKITGDFKRVQASSILAVAVEVFHNGVSKGGKSEGGAAGRWWEGGLPVEQGVLGKEKTPFALLWIDRYAEVKSTGNP